DDQLGGSGLFGGDEDVGGADGVDVGDVGRADADAFVGGAGGEDGALVHDEWELAVFEAVGDEQGALDRDFFGVVIADGARAQFGPCGFVFGGGGGVQICFRGCGGDGLGRDGRSRGVSGPGRDQCRGVD